MRKPTPPSGAAHSSGEPSRSDLRHPHEGPELDEERTAEIEVDAADEPDAPPSESLIWPPPEEELNGWQIVQLENTGRTLIEPMRPAIDPATPLPAPAVSTRGPDTPPPAPRLYSTIPTPPAALPLPSDEGMALDRALRVDRSIAREPYSLVPPHATLERDENLPETQVIEPLLHAELSARARDARPAPAPTPAVPDPLPPTPARPMAPSQRAVQSPPAAARPHPAPKIIVQGAHPPAPSGVPDVPTEARLNARDQTHPRGIAAHQGAAPPRPGAHVTVPHAAAEAVDPSALTRIMPLPKDLARPRVPASMIETLRDDQRDASGSLTADPLATNVWPSSPTPATAPTRPFAAASPSLLTPAVTAPPVAPDIVANRRNGLPLWRIALIVIALVAIAEVAYLLLRTMRPAAGATLGSTATAPATPGAANPPAASPAAEAPATAPPATTAAPVAPAPAAPVPVGAEPSTASLEVKSDPAGARVAIDGVDRGQTPLVVSGLAPGRRQVRVSGPFPTIIRHITLTAGRQGAMSVAPRPATEVDRSSASPATREGGAAAQISAGQISAGQIGPGDAATRPAPTGRGWLTIDSPIVLRVVRNGDFLGTSEDGRIPLPAGTHEIALENESVNFREVRRVDVPVNRGVGLSVALPQGSININAVPWAEVFVDGQRIGDTPVSQFALPIGSHEILYRHPQFGDRRVTVVVKVGAPGRTFVDFTK